MSDIRTSWFPALGRIVRFEARLAWRAARSVIRSPSDAIAFGAAGFIGVLLIAAALQKVLALEHSRYFLMISLLPGLVSYRAARTAIERMHRFREFGIMSPDASEPNAATAYALGLAGLASLLSFPPAAILASFLSELTVWSWALGPVSALSGMAAGLSHLREARSDPTTLSGASSARPSSTTVSDTQAASVLTAAGISSRRRLHPMPERSRRSVTIIAAGLVVGGAAAILPSGRANALPGVLIKASATSRMAPQRAMMLLLRSRILQTVARILLQRVEADGSTQSAAPYRRDRGGDEGGRGSEARAERLHDDANPKFAPASLRHLRTVRGVSFRSGH